MRRLPYLRIVVAAFLVACGERDAFTIGPKQPYDSGPTGFAASAISFRGRSLGHASAWPPPQRFSDNFWVYRWCEVTQKEPGYDGECKEWRILEIATGKVSPLNAPGLNSTLSYPAFLWPYVAYVETGKPSTSGQRAVNCVVWDFRAKKTLQRKKAHVNEDTFGTDVGGLFGPPIFSENKGRTTVAFNFSDDGPTEKPLCSLVIP